MGFPSHPTFSASRRRFLAAAPALGLLPVRSARAAAGLRIGLTPVFLDDQISFNARWRRWFEDKLERPVTFVQRGNYREVVDLLVAGKIDCAWLCGYPYVRHRRHLRLAAVPLWQGKPLYQSYLIVPAAEAAVRGFAELRGRVFAYSDPDSNSGFLYPQYALRNGGENPARYFSRTFFTWSHRNVVEAVSVGLADGGAVDGYVWEMLARIRPTLTAGTRVVERSPLLGFPPFVARADLPEAEFRAVRAALLGMASDPRGVELLGRLGLDGFSPGTPDLFDGIARMIERMGRA